MLATQFPIKHIRLFSALFFVLTLLASWSVSRAAEIVSYSANNLIKGRDAASQPRFAYEISDGVMLVECQDTFYAVKKKNSEVQEIPEILLKVDEKTPIYLSSVAAAEKKPLTFVTHGGGGGNIQFFDPLKKELTSTLLPRGIEPTTLQMLGDQAAVTIDAFTGQLLFFSPKLQTAAFADKKKEADLVHARLTRIDSTGKKLFFGGFSSQFGVIDITKQATPKLLWVKKYANARNYPYTPDNSAFSDDGKYIVFVTYNSHLLLIRATDGALLDQLELMTIGDSPDWTYMRILGSKLCIGVNTRTVLAPLADVQSQAAPLQQQPKLPVCGVFAVSVENDKLTFQGGKKFDRIIRTATNSANCYCLLGDEMHQIPHEMLYEIVSTKNATGK